MSAEEDPAPVAAPTLVTHTVTLHLAAETHGLLEQMAQRQHMSFDVLAQVLVVYGAFLLASADLGLLEGIGAVDLSPQQITPTIKAWLRKDEEQNQER